MIINDELGELSSGASDQESLIRESVASLAEDYFPEFLMTADSSVAETKYEDLFTPIYINTPPLPYDIDHALTEISGACLENVSDEHAELNGTRRDFPMLSQRVNGHPLVWFDNAATTQKPQCVIDRIVSFYEHENSNVHRGAHTLAKRTTDAYENARAKAAAFLNASSPQEIVFVRGTTEAINLVAHSYGLPHLGEGDEIIITQLEHHANIVPWQLACTKTGAKLLVAPVNDNGQIDLPAFEKLLSTKTKLAAITHVSNAIGTVTPVAQIIQIAHQHGAKVLLDGAQAVAHLPVDVQALDCDFYAFSGHKAFGPMGVGVLYAKSELLNDMPPYQGGGSMIEDVTIDKTTYKAAPYRFEAGTGHIAGALGLGAALDYIRQVGLDRIEQYEKRLLMYADESLRDVSGLTLIGKPQTGIISFVMNGVSAEQIGERLDRQGIAVRAGHHCAQPTLRHLGYESTVRASLAFYNIVSEIDRLVSALRNIAVTPSYWTFPPIPPLMSG
jgi:cysteine desulfurase/selenocysteine lyase